MARPAPSSLPPLSEPDSILLTRLIELNEDLYKLAEENGESILTLFSWRSRPDISAYLTAHRELSAHLLNQEALAALRTLMRSSEDPIERRRAANTIIRGLKDPAALRRSTPSVSTVLSDPFDEPDDPDPFDDDPEHAEVDSLADEPGLPPPPGEMPSLRGGGAPSPLAFLPSLLVQRRHRM